MSVAPGSPQGCGGIAFTGRVGARRPGATLSVRFSAFERLLPETRREFHSPAIWMAGSSSFAHPVNRIQFQHPSQVPLWSSDSPDRAHPIPRQAFCQLQ